MLIRTIQVYRTPWRIVLALVLGCSLPAFSLAAEERAESAPGSPATVAVHPVATDVQIAADERQTRFVMELDRKISLRAFPLANPYRIVIDIPQVTFQLPPKAGETGKGMIKAFRYGLVMSGGSRIVMDLKRPAKIQKAYVADGDKGEKPRLIVELAPTDRAHFMQALASASRDTSADTITASITERAPVAGADKSAEAGPDIRLVSAQAEEPKVQADQGQPDKAHTARIQDAKASIAGAGAELADPRPVVIIDPGHGGIDNGTQADSGESEKNIVLDFAKALRDRIEKGGKYRVVMTRDDDTFIPLAERVTIARRHKAALFLSIHADALPKGEGDAQGATVYTLSDTASDSEAAKLADAENKADLIAGINFTEEPTDVADILIDLVHRETKAFSSRFARTLVREMRTVARLHKNPLKSAGFRVLKAPDVPSVLLELGYVSNKADLQLLVNDKWRSRTVSSVAQAVDLFFGKRVVAAEPQHQKDGR